jgi:hypothetical protein
VHVQPFAAVLKRPSNNIWTCSYKSTNLHQITNHHGRSPHAHNTAPTTGFFFQPDPQTRPRNVTLRAFTFCKGDPNDRGTKTTHCIAYRPGCRVYTLMYLDCTLQLRLVPASASASASASAPAVPHTTSCHAITTQRKARRQVIKKKKKRRFCRSTLARVAFSFSRGTRHVRRVVHV